MKKFYRIIEITGATMAILFSCVMLFMQLFSQVLGNGADLFLTTVFAVCTMMAILWFMHTMSHTK